MSAYAIDVMLSFAPYCILGVLFLLLAVATRLFTGKNPVIPTRYRPTLYQVRWVLYCAAIITWSGGLFLALSSPTNIPKRETFDKSASHQAIIEQSSKQQEQPKQAIKDLSLKPEKQEDRSERFKDLTDYKARRQEQEQTQ